MGLALKGSKATSGSSRKATRHDDSLFGQDTVELLLGVSEGPIHGLMDGASSFYVGDVPLLDKASQTPNISNFELRLFKGTNPADSIKLNLGGRASTKNVGLDLRTAGQSVVVPCDKTQIDYLDLRFVVQRLLMASKEGGEFPTDVQVRIEVKPRSSATWQIPFDNQPPPQVETGSGSATFRPGTTTPGTLVNDAYRETYVQNAAPAGAKARGAMWFDSSTAKWTPKIWDGAAWANPASLAAATRSGYDIWTWLDFDGAQRAAWFSPSGSAPPPGTLAKGDFLLTPAAGEQVYSYNDTAWVGFQTWAQPKPAAPGILTINGLTRSTYPKEYRIPVARINEPYDVRITRISPASTKDVLRDIQFEGLQEVNRDAVSFPDLAVAWLTIKATDTFTSLPDFTGIYRGLVIPVPSNYTFDETTKSGTYAGIWDGSFKMAYTNNPAWHAYNFIMNSRYGKNAYYSEVADKWDYYAFGRHCDQHKLRFNDYITEPRSINELVNYIVGIAGGRYVERGDGYSTVIWDADDQVAQAIFAPENTIEGAFTYSFTDFTEQKNDFKVSFKNPELNYREDRVRVFDAENIAVNGRNPEEFVAVGCRDAEEAVRRARLRLATSLSERIIVSFKTNRIGRYLLPFQVILVADDQSTNVITGRIAHEDGAPVGTTRLSLRDPIYLEAGISYGVQFTVSDGNGGMTVVTYPLTVATPGLQSQLVLSRALAEALPEFAVFSIGTPKAFRITGIDPDDEDPDVIDVTAIEVNRLKWAFVDGTVELRDLIGRQTGPLSKFVYAPTGARITPEIDAAGQLALVTTWQASETKLIRGYRVTQSLNGRPMTLVYEGDQLTYRLQRPEAGTYVHSIVAVGLDGSTESAPATVQYIVSNGTSLRSVAPPTNLRLIDEPEAPIFRGVDARFTWDAAADPLVTKYRVEVVSPANAVVHGETVSNVLRFTYGLAANRAENGGTPLRQFTLRVRSIDATGNLSDPVDLVVSHPAPPATAFTLRATTETVFVNLTRPAGDWAGALVWMETATGFDPLAKTPAYDGQNTTIALPAKVDTTYYVRVASYDSYGKTGLNVSAEQAITTSLQAFDASAPTIPGRPSLLSATVDTNAVDGSVTATVRLTWAASTGNFADLYEVQLKQGSGGYIQYAVSGNIFEKHGLLPNTAYTVRVRAVSKNRFAASGWSEEFGFTTAKSLAVPGNVTGAGVVTSLDQAILTWTNPTVLDLAGVEVWIFLGSSSAAAPPSGATMQLAARGATNFVDKLGVAATKTYWLRAVSSSGVPAASYVRVGPVTAVQLEVEQIRNGIIDATKIATGLEFVQSVASLPEPATWTGSKTVRNGADGKLYRLFEGKWSAAVSGGDITAGLDAAMITKGQLTKTQIASLDAATIVGEIAGTQIKAGAVAFAKLDPTLQPPQVVSTLPNPSGWTGSKVLLNLADGKLYRLVDGAWSSKSAAADLTGLVTSDQIDKVAAAKVSGILSDDQIGTVTASKIDGLLSKATIDAKAISGQITGTQISDDAISTPKLAANAISADKIATNAVLASKIVVADWANLFGNPVFEGGSADSWVGVDAVVDTVTNTAGLFGTAPSRYVGSTAATEGTRDIVGVSWIPVVPGEVWYIAADVGAATANTNVSCNLYIRTTDAKRGAGTPNNVGGSFVPGAAWETRTGIFRVPAGKSFILAGMRLSGTTGSVGTVAHTNWKLRRMASSELIVDGSITAEKIVADAVKAGKVDANAITGREIVAGSISTRHLTVTSINLAYNPDGAQGTRGWSRGGNAPNLVGPALWNVAAYAPAGVTPFYLNAAGAALADLSGKNMVMFTNQVTPTGALINYRMTPSQWYEFSACVSTHRCSCKFVVNWYNAGNTLVGQSVSPTVSNNAPSGGSYRDFPKVSLIAQAPSTATNGQVFFEAFNATGDNPYLFVSCFMMAPSYKDAPETSPYTPPGATVIDGSTLITGTVQAVHIKSGSITTDKLDVTNVTAGILTSGVIKAGMIDGNAVTAETIASGAITAGKLLISDPTNMVTNGDFGGASNDGSLDGWNAYGTLSGSTGDDPGGRWRLRSNQRDHAISNYIQGRAGETIYVRAMVYNDGTYPAQLMIVPENYSKTILGYPVVASTAVRGAWVLLEGRVVLPANTGRFRVLLQRAQPSATAEAAWCYWGRVVAQRAAAGELIVDGAITADKVAANAILGRHLAIASANRAFNADYTLDKLGWSLVASSPGGVSAVLDKVNDAWAPAGMKALNSRTTTAPTGTGGYYDVYNRIVTGGETENVESDYPLAANQTYELSAYLSAHRCDGYILVSCLTPDGAQNFSSNLISKVALHSSDTLSTWDARGRAKVIFKVPAGTTSVMIRVRSQNYATGSSQPAYLFISGMMLAAAYGADQTDVSPYANPGVTVIDGGSLLTNAVDARVINAGSINTDHIDAKKGISTAVLTADWISAGAISTGAIKADQIDAGAITTDKIGIGLGSGNLLFNSDFNADLQGWATDIAAELTASVDFTHDSPSRGLTRANVRRGNGKGRADLAYRRRKQLNGDPDYYPVTPGIRYELSATFVTNPAVAEAYLILKWIDKDGLTLSEPNSGNARQLTTDQKGGRTTGLYASRMGFTAVAPAGAVAVNIILRTFKVNASVNSQTWWTAVYFGEVKPAIDKVPDDKYVFAPWSPIADTVIDGGFIATDTIVARQIKNGSLLTEHISVSSPLRKEAMVFDGSTGIITGINAVTTTKLNANVISVSPTGVGRPLTGFFTGTDNTFIDGGTISANSIKANTLQIGSRGVSVQGIEFYMGRNPTTGAVTNLLYWTGGSIDYVDDNTASATYGKTISRSISANTTGTNTGGNTWYVFWKKGATTLTPFVKDTASNSNFTAWMNDADALVMCATSGSTGIQALYGSTQIDGSKITALSISGTQIAANAINAGHISAINSDVVNLAVSDVAAGKITTGALSAGTTIDVGSSRFQLRANSRQLVISDGTRERVVIGDLGNNAYGAIFRSIDGTIILNTGGAGADALGDGVVAGASLAAGAGSNLIPNSDFERGTGCWGIRGSTIANTSALIDAGGNTLKGGHVLSVMMPGASMTTAGQVVDVSCYGMMGGTSGGVPVEPNTRYELSVYVSCRGACDKAQIVYFAFDASGGGAGAAATGPFAAKVSGNRTVLGHYTRLTWFITTSSTAATLVPGVRFFSDGSGALSYGSLTRMFMAKARPNQTEFSDWSGYTPQAKISGTNAADYVEEGGIPSTYIASLAADKVVVGTGGLSAISANVGTVTAGVIRSVDSKMQIDLSNGRILISD